MKKTKKINYKKKKQTIKHKIQKGGANEIIGLDYDGVLELNVKPLFNSQNSRLVIDKIAKKYYDEFITKLTAYTYPKFIITKNTNLKYDVLDAKIKALLNNQSANLIINTDDTKIANLQKNKINYYFDDSNKHIFDVYINRNLILKLFKVFPETIYDICDNRANPTKANGTMNPIIVDINLNTTVQIKVLTYNIKNDSHMKRDNTDANNYKTRYINIKNTLIQNMQFIPNKNKKTDPDKEPEPVDFICLQEFSYVYSTVKTDTAGKSVYHFDESKGHPLNKLNVDFPEQNSFKDITLQNYGYVYNFQSPEMQFTFYNKINYEIVKDGADDLIFRGRTDNNSRPFTIIVFKQKLHSQNIIVVINVHFPHPSNQFTKAGVDNSYNMTNDFINDIMVSHINNTLFDNNDIKKGKTMKKQISGNFNMNISNKIIEYLKTSRIIMAGDFNRTIYSNDKKPNYYSNNTGYHSCEIDNSAYGLKLFKGLFLDNPTKSIIMYNIPRNNTTFNKNTNGGIHKDNVLDSFGLQYKYEYFDDTRQGSDHTAVLVTLLDAVPIFKLDDLKIGTLQTVAPTVAKLIPAVATPRSAPAPAPAPTPAVVVTPEPAVVSPAPAPTPPVVVTPSPAPKIIYFYI
jgi:hypothetical protein